MSDWTPKPETVAARADAFLCPHTGALIPAVHPSTTYARDADYQKVDDRGYSRDDNPSYEMVEAVLTRLEEGHASKVFSSGMAAITSVFQALRPGDHVVVARDSYFGVGKWLRSWAIPWGLEVDFVDATDSAQVQAALRPGRTALVHVETPANPTWCVVDVAAAARVAHAAGALLMVDNTVPTPVLTRPITLGADLVAHSATKYLNGHSDVVAGALVAAADTPVWQRVGEIRYLAGAVLGPFESWLLLRGMRTLYVRVRQSSASALAIAEHFARDPRVAEVCYPGLPGFPGHAVAARQMQGGFGGMLSLRLAGGRDAALDAAKRARLFVRATSLGGVESLIEHRATVEGDDGTAPPDLIRLSVGCEAVDDLIADLDQALGPAMPLRAAVGGDD